MTKQKPDDINRRKLCVEKLITLGINPYPARCQAAIQLHKIYKEKCDDFPSLEEVSSKNNRLTVRGRIILMRCMGRNTFITIQGSNHFKMQLLVSRDKFYIVGMQPTLDISPYNVITKLIDIGDFLSITGPIFKTKKQEITIFAEKIEILCKALLPLPDKHCGLKNTNIAYRKRWLDMISNQQSFDKLNMRCNILSLIRTFMNESGFIEAELPVLQNIYGGAQAHPFTTYCTDLNKQMFLRIALELPLKELLVGGLEKVYEIGKVFRNEAIDRTHNPEFTSLEAYAAYWDYNDIMLYISSMVHFIFISLYKSDTLDTLHIQNGVPVSLKFNKEWPKKRLVDIVSGELNIDACICTREEIKLALSNSISKERLDALNIEEMSKGKLMLTSFEELCEHKILGPLHVIDYPIESTPFCKVSSNQYVKEVSLVERFESFVMGMEICNAYSELNDPILQRQLVEKSAKICSEKEECNPIDEMFLSAIDQGMPPSAGFGLGVDRLVMIVTKSNKIADILFFPLMR